MRKRATAFIVTALAVILAPTAGAQVPGEDSVTGQGLFAISGISQLTVDARSGPSGENPSGTVQIFGSTGAVTSQVTCLHVTDNRAVVGFRAESGTAGIIEITDNGPSLDTVTLNLGEFPTSESNCPATLPQPDGTFPLLIPPPSPFLPPPGDLVVVDAQPPPLPTSRAQCKDGGWQQYAFKNQGQCVAFVNRGA